MKFRHLLVFIGISMILIILIPIVLYTYHFGIGFWNSSAEWGDLGSFFGGILSPMLTFFSILLLLLTVYFTNKTLELSQEATLNQEKQLNLIEKTSVTQIIHSESVRFDSIFFNQISLVHNALNNAKLQRNGKEIKAHDALSEDFQKYVINKKKFDAAFYQASLSQAIESFDQLVKIVETICPQKDKKLYQDLVKYNVSIHFRWWVRQSWQNVHPENTHQIKLLAEKYGAIEI